MQEGTRARPGRKARIINLGLHLEEAIQMGLEVEKVNHKGNLPVADYLSENWKKWLQSNRIELNAMSTPQFIQWLNNKMEIWGQSKLIPPQEVLIDKLQSDVINNLEDVIAEEILKDSGLDKLVDEAYKQLENDIIDSKITIYVEQELKKTPINSWRKPVEQMAKEIINRRRKYSR